MHGSTDKKILNMGCDEILTKLTDSKVWLNPKPLSKYIMTHCPFSLDLFIKGLDILMNMWGADYNPMGKAKKLKKNSCLPSKIQEKPKNSVRE